MISTTEATRIIADNAVKFQKKKVPLLECSAKMVAENSYADRDFPPYERVTMDGIAIKASSWTKGVRNYEIERLQPAGSIRTKLQGDDNAIEIMTGAILPENTDAVIQYEEIEIMEKEGKRIASIQSSQVVPYQNVHRMGEDRKAGELLIPEGTIIAAPEIGVMASAGMWEVLVYDFPHVAIISTGDELVEVNEVPEAHQIRKSNVYSIQTELTGLGIVSELFHLPDSKDALFQSLQSIMKEYPVLILSGGVSKGKLDYVPGVLEALGIKKFFHGVKQRPGKPFWFGRSGDNTVFALPGNPVSTFMCFQRYVKMWFERCLSVSPKRFYAGLTEDVLFKPELTYFLQVKIHVTPHGKIEAAPVAGHGSGDLANMLQADGFLELPPGQPQFRAGDSFPLHLFRSGWSLQDAENNRTE
ncbi:MAG: molybdopterin molybdotransferase MoeA [Bacteroidetes bacterium]|nr:molybdopterin molybdotransferase MoeA [Bacteroidota bacterium]